MDINRALRTAVDTGKVHIGFERSRKTLRSGKAKMIVVSSNCPKKQVELLTKSGVPVYRYEGSNIELGAACGKPFSISSLVVVEPGESDILSAVKA